MMIVVRYCSLLSWCLSWKTKDEEEDSIGVLSKGKCYKLFTYHSNTFLYYQNTVKSDANQPTPPPKPPLSHGGNLVKFGCVVFELRERTDRQTDRHTHCNTLHPPLGEVMIYVHIVRRSTLTTALSILTD